MRAAKKNRKFMKTFAKLTISSDLPGSNRLMWGSFLGNDHDLFPALNKAPRKAFTAVNSAKQTNTPEILIRND